MCYMFLFRAIMQKSEHANIIVNSTLQLCAALQLQKAYKKVNFLNKINKHMKCHELFSTLKDKKY